MDKLQRAGFTEKHKLPSLPLTGNFLYSTTFSYINTMGDNKSAFIKLYVNALMFSFLLYVLASSFLKVRMGVIESEESKVPSSAAVQGGK